MEVFHNVESAAKILNINENTFTRYYLDFEEAGHIFKRSQDNKLMFSEDDIELFREFMELKNQPKMTKKKAIEQLITTPASLVTVRQTDITSLISSINGQFEELKVQSKQELQELKVQLKQLQEYSSKQFEELQQLKLLEDSRGKDLVKERDRLLMESLRENQERKIIEQENKEKLDLLQKQNELIMKEIAAAKEHNKKGWWQFWKK